VSDEAAFLAALKANPADDLTRLVYADWLDEHAEPQKAEYLRLVAALAQPDFNHNAAEGARYLELTARLPEEWRTAEGARCLELAAQLPEEWRTAAGSRFALVLDAFTDKVKAIKWIREVTGDTLGEAKEASEKLPYVVLAKIPFELATAREIVPNGTFVTLRIVPCAPIEPDDGRRYNLVASVWRLAGGGLGADRTALAAVIAAARGVSEAEADRLMDLDSHIELLAGLTLTEARNRRLALMRLIRPDLTRGWWIGIHHRPAANIP
jgi:uncharacterized protein (TIGR02996 family)